MLVMYKDMNLEDGFHNNYKELARRMQDAGWERNNNQCHRKVSTIVKFFLYLLMKYFISAFQGSIINYWLSDRDFVMQI